MEDRDFLRETLGKVGMRMVYKTQCMVIMLLNFKKIHN